MTISENEQDFETVTSTIVGASIQQVTDDILMSYDDVDLTRDVNLKEKKVKTRAERIRRVNTKYRQSPDMGRLASRQRFVAGRGNIRADIMFVGDMPSGDESVTGRALDGKRREVVKYLLQGIDCKEDQTYTTYLLKYRTPNGRMIKSIEVLGIKHLLLEEIDAVRPKVIVTWGRQALETLIPNASLYQLHGQELSFGDAKLVPMFSPEAVLVNPEAMNDVRRDFQAIHRCI